MTEVAGVVPQLAGEAARRAEAALAQRKAPEQFDVEQARGVFARMIGGEQRQRNSVS
jgi:hypothetical protein